MNGRALNDRAIEVSPSSSRVSDPGRSESTLKSVLSLYRYSIALPDLSRWVAHPSSLHSLHLKIVHDLEIGHAHRAASATSNDEQLALGVRIQQLVNRWIRTVKLMVCYVDIPRNAMIC